MHAARGIVERGMRRSYLDPPWGHVNLRASRHSSTVVPSIFQVNSHFSSQIPDLVRVDVEAPNGRVLRQRRNWPNLLHLASTSPEIEMKQFQRGSR